MRKLAYKTCVDENKTVRTGVANHDVYVCINTSDTAIELFVNADGSYKLIQSQGKAELPFSFKFDKVVHMLKCLVDGTLETVK